MATTSVCLVRPLAAMMPNHSGSVLPYRASMLRTWAAMPSSTLAMASPFALAVDFGEPPGEELPLGGRRVEGERGPVGVARLGGASQPAQQVGAAGVQQVPAPALAVLAELVEDGQAGRGSLGHGHRDRPVGVHHGRRLMAGQGGVQGRYLGPVGGARLARGGVA